MTHTLPPDFHIPYPPLSSERFPQFSKNLRFLRKEIDRSIAWVARRVGISRVYLWELEHDHEGKKQISVALAWRLAKFYDVRSDFDVLISGDMEQLREKQAQKLGFKSMADLRQNMITLDAALKKARGGEAPQGRVAYA